MDLKSPGWFGQLQISGIAKPINVSGTVMGMTAQLLSELRHVTPRSLTNGKQLTILFSDKPFDENKASREAEDRVSEIESGLDVEPEGGPLEGETHAQFVLRLVGTGLSESQATWIANDWFERPQPTDLMNWLNDPRAIQFRKLNSSHAAFENAMPGEYALLADYVRQTYPAQCAAITFRAA